MEDIIIVAVLILILGGAALYVYKAKKRGVKCIGCPDGGSCAGKCAGCAGNCGCRGQEEADQ